MCKKESNYVNYCICELKIEKINVKTNHNAWPNGAFLASNDCFFEKFCTTKQADDAAEPLISSF